MRLKDLKNWAIAQLQHLTQLPAPSNVSPQTLKIEVDVLLQSALELTKEQLIIKSNDEIDRAIIEKFQLLISRRAKSEPVAYIIGKKEFYKRTFIVNNSVLIPRPETEILVELALKNFTKMTKDFYLLDVGTGSGAIVLSIIDELREKFGQEYLKSGEIHAVDISDKALNIARKNSDNLQLSQYVKFYNSDLLNQIKINKNRTLILIVANPPYIMESVPLPSHVGLYEPYLALRAGADGLDIIRRLLAELLEYLQAGAKLIMEIGEEQEDGITKILQSYKIGNFEFVRDYSEKTRFLLI
ncbi:MAG: peptide chain release factor N(5)-glutamine methyltransferase [Deltaproteobacteria bacterium]|jgi:release factor glutamine methyltransferase|nr:peptide chain release factor N(5)-glutamine methyltransferase [Deltaproteobacteria bacterium]